MIHARGLVLVLALLPACAGERDEVGDAQGTAGDGDTSACTPGRFGCTCDAAQTCSEGLECNAGVCELVDEAATSGGAPPSSCGWNLAASWYDCGFTGSDPTGMHPITCPDGLVADTTCPANLPFEGCCDDAGDVWYCDQGQVVHTTC